MTDEVYTGLTRRLTRATSRAVLGLLGYRNDALREYLRALYEQPAGSDGAFLADPVFEATFGWQTAEETMGNLSGKLLEPHLVKALANPPKALAEDYTFPRKRQPYRHQVEAWRALIEQEPPRSVLVSSGTGSGKTECFLIPILNDLAAQAGVDRPALTGVRALFLYPLNALIKSQKDRLAAWSEPFDGRIRWCLYNGETPETSPPRRALPWRSQVAGRDVLRADPPPILVTNATMLEYMLVRGVDRPILDQSQGKLRWIVIDEAHSYLGSQAAELALLLRRVLLAFGCESDNVHFVATSATIGSGEASRAQLQSFLADIAGVDPSRVTVILGERAVPPIGDDLLRRNVPLPSPLSLREMGAAERFEAFASNRTMRDVRARLVEGAARLADLNGVLGQGRSEEDRVDTLELLDLCTGAINEVDQPFLPLRGHLFERGQAGLWVCANRVCPGRDDTPLDSVVWPYGSVFTERREHCLHCDFPIFELQQCGDCGQEVLSAELVCDKDGDRLRPRDSGQDDDEFQLDLESLEDDAEGSVDGDERAPPPKIGLKRLLAPPGIGQTVDRISRNGCLDGPADECVSIAMQVPDAKHRLHCPTCGAQEQGDFPLFRSSRIGAPFLLQIAIPELLNHVRPMSSGAGDAPRPLDGRRVMAFTDSRQGTARIAARLQQEAERNYVRSLLFHQMATESEEQDKGKIDELRRQIETLRPLTTKSPNLKPILQQLEEQLAAALQPTIRSLSWQKATSYLLGQSGFNRFVVNTLRDLTFGLKEREIAELCLWREFLFRPKRQFSLEGLGLLRLDYPAIGKISNVPAVLQQRRVTLDEWRDLLRVVTDVQVRGWMAVPIPWDMLRWIGYPGKPSVMLPPGAIKTRRDQRSWPTARTPAGRGSRLVRLLAYAFKLDPEEDSGQSMIEEMIHAIWAALASSTGPGGTLLTATEGGVRYLDLPEKAEIAEVREAWFCPVTRRLLPATFRGITPYLPERATDALAQCEKVELPRLPNPFWDGNRKIAEQWLETDEQVIELRRRGAWTDLNDRIAGFADYFRAVEHSAQIDSALLTRREGEFKDGRINLLSCSTTMEMGVDIGGLSAVAMNNVPPHPANFLQRAGRAGRRGETAALSFTLCKNTPHGEAVFANPLWAFTTALSVPRVGLQSARIVQRHVNALALTAFLFEQTGKGPFRLNCGWFFEPTEQSSVTQPSERFLAWCQDLATVNKLAVGLQRICYGSVLAGIAPEALLAQTATALERINERWREELDALLANLDTVKTDQGNSRPEKAIGIQLERMRREYLLGELATRSFLPGYGFPTGVVPLLTSTIETIKYKDGKQREDNRALSRASPSRPLAIAVRDYAPGTDTTLDGRVYRSGGVSLNWHLPAQLNAGPEIQSLRWVWRCASCGGSGTRPVLPRHCPHCNESNPQKFTRYEYLQPGGFAVDIRAQPHNNVSVQQYIPVRDPLISVQGAPWMWLPTPFLGRYRYSAFGHIFHRSDGLHGKGYSLCLRCGRSDSMTTQGVRPDSMAGHKRLRGGRNDDSELQCPANAEPGLIKDNLLLGTAVHTDVFELQLRQPDTERTIDRIQAYSIGVVLRRALCRSIGIEEDEIGVSVGASRGPADEAAQSIYLFDASDGGAGYVGLLVPRLPALLTDAAGLLECRCDKACQSCLLSHDTQHHVDLLDRHAAAALLDRRFLAALELPADLRAFGQSTRLELEPLPTALRREIQRRAVNELRVYLGGDVQEWEPLAWFQRQDLARWIATGIAVTFVLRQKDLDALSTAQVDELAAVTAYAGHPLVAAQEQNGSAVGSGLPAILEISGPGGSVCWAASSSRALAPTIDWGSGSQETRFVLASFSEPLRVLPADWPRVAADALRRPVTGILDLEITRELDGASLDFGERAWDLILTRDTLLADRLRQPRRLLSATYSDRYLRSPLTTQLLHSMLVALAGYAGGTDESTIIRLITEPVGRDDTREPSRVIHDWSDGQVRRELWDAFFSALGRFELEERQKAQIPHARVLTLTWEDGAVWTLRMDQGVGYWRMARGASGRFPFESGVENQLDRLRKANLIVEGDGSGLPTYWYCGHGR